MIGVQAELQRPWATVKLENLVVYRDLRHVRLCSCGGWSRSRDGHLICGRRGDHGIRLAACFELFAETCDGVPHRPCSRICQGTHGPPLHLRAKIEKKIEIADVTLARLYATHEALEPARTLSTGCALATALVVIKMRDSSKPRDHVRILVKDQQHLLPHAGSYRVDPTIIEKLDDELGP